MEDPTTIRFRTIYVIEPSHDVSALRKYADSLEMLTTGYEDLEELPLKIRRELRNFDPELDAVVPLGKLTAALFTGLVIAFMGVNPLWVGIYRNKDYTFHQIGIPDAT